MPPRVAVAPFSIWNCVPKGLAFSPAVPRGIERSPIITNPAVDPLVGALRLSVMEPGMSIIGGLEPVG